MKMTMKKTVVATCAAFLVMTCFADRSPGELYAYFKGITNNHDKIAACKAITEKEWRGICENILECAATNVSKAVCMFYVHPTVLLPYAVVSDELLSYFDEKLASAGVTIPMPWYYNKLPKTSEAWVANVSNATEVARMQATIALTKAHGHFNFYSYPVQEKANLLMEIHRISPDNIEDLRNNVINKATLFVKRSLRDRGFRITVGPDGVNPVQAQLDRLYACLNAPRYAGLKEWFAEFVPDYKWVDSEWETDSEIDELKEKIYYGELDFSRNRQECLKANLGTDEYNKFVERFNSGK